MGNQIGMVSKELNTGAENGMKDTASTLDLLSDLASEKANSFHTKLISVRKLKEYHISKVSALNIQQFVEMKESVAVTEGVKSFVQDMADKDFVNGITKFVTGTIDKVIGTGAGNENKETEFKVFVKGIGIHRVDFYVYTRSIEVQSLTNIKTQVISIAWAISSIDVTEISRGDVNQIVSAMEFTDENGI